MDHVYINWTFYALLASSICITVALLIIMISMARVLSTRMDIMEKTAGQMRESARSAHAVLLELSTTLTKEIQSIKQDQFDRGESNDKGRSNHE